MRANVLVRLCSKLYTIIVYEPDKVWLLLNNSRFDSFKLRIRPCDKLRFFFPVLIPLLVSL